eukprot:TRINITY_DN1315_c1_g2_i1.p1 TRINITY_DN1315_c1_g2~~TRINITY_DN1315_c1_g2_i1.p1  ORF type:complete len:463 (-),score=112.66 TRINITY_DN1315_c1_g2_i1:103-1491(-)
MDGQQGEAMSNMQQMPQMPQMQQMQQMPQMQHLQSVETGSAPAAGSGQVVAQQDQLQQQQQQLAAFAQPQGDILAYGTDAAAFGGCCAQQMDQFGQQAYLQQAYGYDPSFAQQAGLADFGQQQFMSAASQAAVGGMYHGVIKSFDEDKGFGFIECPEARSASGMDVFLLRSQLQGSSVRAGDQVTFSVTQSTKGPRAENVQVLHAAGSAAPPPMQDQTAMGCPGRPQSSAAVPQVPMVPPEQLSTSYHGTIKNFDGNKGFGFISCDETRKLTGKDVLLLRSQIQGGINPQSGDQVAFSVEDNNGKGLKATTCVVIARNPGAALAGAGVPGAVPGQAYMGAIKEFDAGKGFGFISCDQTRGIYGKDVFLLRSALREQPANPGDPVQFTVQMGEKGPVAHNVQVMTQGAVGGCGLAGLAGCAGCGGLIGGCAVAGVSGCDGLGGCAYQPMMGVPQASAARSSPY